jgi:hypothetical protein
MKVAGDERGAPKDGVRWPGMSMEDPDAIDAEPARRMQMDLARERSNQPDVVISGHDRDIEAIRKESRKELEQLTPERRRHSNDRLFEVARKHETPGTRRLCNSKEFLRDFFGPSAGRAGLTGAETP